MKGKGKYTVKKIMSIMLAIALIVTGISYTPKAVSAADTETIKSGNRTYTIVKKSSTIDGWVQGAFSIGDANQERFAFMWGAGGPAQVNVVITQGDTTKLTLNNQGNGFGIYTKDLASYSEGEYTITITATDNVEKTAVVALTIAGSGTTPTETSTNPATSPSTEAAPDYSGITVTDDDWELIGTQTDGSKIYISKSYYAKFGGSGYKQYGSDVSQVGYKEAGNTVTGAVIQFAFARQDQFASLWVNKTNIPEGDKFYKNKTNAPDVFTLSTSLFEEGITYVTIREKNNQDTILPVKLVKDTTLKPDLVSYIEVSDAGYHVLGKTIDFKVTVKNEGSADAVLTTRNATETNLVIKWTNNKVQKNYYVTKVSEFTSKDGSYVLEPGNSVSHTFTITLTSEMLTGSYMVGGVVILENGLDATINESSTANNQSEEVPISVYPGVTLTNTNGTITATADAAAGVTNYNLSYVSGKSAVTVANENFIIADGKVTYTFPENAIPDHDTVVELKNADTNSVIAVSNALANLVITSVETDGPAIVNQQTGIKMYVKNIGVASATSKNSRIVYAIDKKNSDDAVTLQNRYVEYDDGVKPNETIAVTGLTLTPTSASPVTLYAKADESNNVVESDEGTGNYNQFEFTVSPVLAGELSVVNTDGKVMASWTKNAESAEPLGYILTYYSGGVQKTIETSSDVTTTQITDAIDYNSKITIAAKYDSGNETFAQQTALPDLKIKTVELSGGVNSMQTEIYKGKIFSAKVTFENTGITEVPASSNDITTDYGKWIMVSLDGTTNIASYDDANKKQFVSEGIYQGVPVNGESSVTFERLVSSAEGSVEFTVKVDSPAFAGTEVEGFIPESDETNNSMTITKTTVLPTINTEMEWTKFTATDLANIDESGNPYVVINNGSDKRCVEYKVLDTSVKNIDYADIMTKVQAYGGQYIAYGINAEAPIVVSTDSAVSTKLYFAQVSSYTAENYTSDMDSTINYGDARTAGDGILQTFDGNGFQLHTRSFAAGKYYIVKLVNDDGTYLTLGMRIPGDIGKWVKAKAKDNSDPDKVPLAYHKADYGIEGTIYYDGSDLGLAGISVYNNNHLALTTDGTKPLNLEGGANWKMTIAYADVDAADKFIEQIPDDILSHIGADPGTIDLVPTSGILGSQGNNTILIKLPELMQQLPIHSSLGGQQDFEYYILKVYYDTVDHPDEYIPVPLRIVGNIPEIEAVNGLTAGKRGEALSVSWTDSITQSSNGYLYDVLIYTCDKDGTNESLIKEDNGVTAGSYTYENLVNSSEFDTTNFKVKVVAHWCEQETSADDAAVTVVSTLPDPLPGEEPGTREDNWVLIDGQSYLPISDGNGGETKAEIWYYTDENMNAVIGYNDEYILLNGNEQYFVGPNTQIFVQNDNEDGRQFIAKGIYETVYKGQLQMDAAKMFSVYEGGPATDGYYYYTVKVRDGENTASYHNFYFRVKVTDNPEEKVTTEEWKPIKGTSTLPVKFNYKYTQDTVDLEGNVITETVNKTIEVNGTIEFYDAVAKTNTYAITGYNGYYMSLIGATDLYAGNNKGTNSVSMEIANTGTTDNSSMINVTDGKAAAEDLTYEPAAIYDSYYPGETQINAPTVFTVTNPTTYYMLKITGTDETGTVVTKYLPIRITVLTGDVKLEGYQINTNTGEGAVSEFNPSFRAMSSASQLIAGSDGKLHGVKNFGTIYGLKSRVSSADQMVINSTNTNVFAYQATSMGVYGAGIFGQSNIGDEKSDRTYWAITFKHLNYSYDAIVTNYVLRAYAVLDNGEVVYDNNTYGFDGSNINVYNIATNLYKGKKMSNKTAHDFLFNNVISIVDINNNIYNIGMSMLNVAGEANYETVNNVYRDLFDYARGQDSYSDNYQTRQTTGFVGKRQLGSETDLLSVLNGATGTYSTIIDWIAGETTYIQNKIEFNETIVMP